MAEDGALGTPDFSTPRDLLAAMEVRVPGRRRADGTVVQDLIFPVRLFMYGPFLRLPRGLYCLHFDGQFPAPLQRGHPMMGVEVIAQNRMLRAWRDFTHDELNRDDRNIYFEVPDDLSIESGADAPFEFRFTGFGTARFAITALTLRRAAPADLAAAPPMRWRMLGRLRLVPRSGGVKLSRSSVTAPQFWRSWSPFFLPSGLHRLDLTADLRGDWRLDEPALDVAVRTREGAILGNETFSAGQLAAGNSSFLFDVPVDASLDSGMPQKIDVTLRYFRPPPLTIQGIDVTHLPTGPDAHDRRLVRSVGRGTSTKKKVLIFGNCQANMVARALRENSGFAKRFSVKHHFMELPPNLHDQGRRDIDEADLMLVQDIGEWDQYPLRPNVPADLETLRFPCVRFASLWPFDAFNGPDDKVARDRDFPNFEFTYFDGLLARLRKEIPDPEQRFRAYRDLDVKGLIDPRRLHSFEEKRLVAMDSKYATGAGAYILDQFRRRQVFYTTAHPNGAVLTMLMKHIGRELGVRQLLWRSGLLDSLRSLQVPVHPRVAEALGVRWAGPRARYLVKGQKVTWEEYVRQYIAYYG